MARRIQKGPFDTLKEAVAFAEGVQYADDSALCIYDAPYKGGDDGWYVEVVDYDEQDEAMQNEPRL